MIVSFLNDVGDVRAQTLIQEHIVSCLGGKMKKFQSGDETITSSQNNTEWSFVSNNHFKEIRFEESPMAGVSRQKNNLLKKSNKKQ